MTNTNADGTEWNKKKTPAKNIGRNFYLRKFDHIMHGYTKGEYRPLAPMPSMEQIRAYWLANGIEA